MHILTPPGQAWINARLTSDKGTIHDRLLDYFDSYGTAIKQFANAPVVTAGFACTGASYLAGAQRENATMAELSSEAGFPVHTAATAVVDALKAINARRIALISPYDETLTIACEKYWIDRGYEVVKVASTWHDSGAFHPIYSLASGAALKGLDSLEGEDVDAVIMLGTGMPTLHAICNQPFLGKAPVLSCMLCIAWRLSLSAAGEEPTSENLLSWVRADHWADPLRRLAP